MEKMVRDKIPEILNRLGKTAVFRKAQRSEVLPFLIAKLREECSEFEAENTLEEMADILDVVEEIISHLSFSSTELQNVRRAKVCDRGSFKTHTIMTI
ncbi:MAG: nucleoside triphosphate pyrophosphohydrolase [Nevskia sp.]|jgi:predicted house-cleaning noncanonical NTP pyrophosphatase (MazG superfamily)|nr:nucleoside triphosphate pyrophosphohydrolase [Nevskia sp.]